MTRLIDPGYWVAPRCCEKRVDDAVKELNPAEYDDDAQKPDRRKET